MRLKDKVAIITGGAGGIGAGLTRAFVREGAKVLFVDINAQNGTALEAELGSSARFLQQDLTQPNAAERIRDAVVARFGKLDVLVNNAHASQPASILDTTQEMLDLAFNSGTWPTWHLMRACHDLLAESKGSVINFASGAGIEGMPNQAAYVMAKEAIRGLSRAAANEWGHEQIRVNVVSPFALSDGVRQWKENFPEQARQSEARVPLGRIGDIDRDIAPVVVFLASDDSRYMTGQTLMADGGSVKLR